VARATLLSPILSDGEEKDDIKEAGYGYEYVDDVDRDRDDDQDRDQDEDDN
jgi:hypothetical protein